MRAGTRPLARQPLAARWRLCATAPGAAPPDTDAPGWRDIAGAGTVAAALRGRGEWSLDGAAAELDAHDWWYEATLDAPPDGCSVLGFDGLATLADTWLNGKPLLSSNSMFLAHACDAGALLRHDVPNRLLIRCAALAPALAQRRPRPRWRTPMVAHQQLRWLRTSLLGRTPGWSPPVAPVGPWRPLWWATPEDAAVDWRMQTAVHGGTGQAALHLEAPEGWWRQFESVEVVLSRHGRSHRERLQRADAGAASARLVVPHVALWWPHTHGEPALYAVELHLQQRDGQQRTVPLGRVGFRTLDLDRGNGGFCLRVNGEPVFCRGAGWTPPDPVSLHAGGEALRETLGRARDAGMNMLRVAGTLVYEDDDFYEACDAMGMLVWQDFMFASMDYPLDDAGFAAQAALECHQQLLRLHHHPCLAVLCGNSEVEQQAAMWGAPRELWQPRFFHEVLPALCRDLAPGVPYWPSSAHGGAFPHQANSGTTSYYGVGAYERPLDDARRSGLRFATECLAFANIPGTAALERMPGGLATRVHHPAWKSRAPRDLGAGWDFDDVRDHYLQQLFGLEPARLRHADHDRYLALGRLATAEVMRAAFSEWRRPGSTCQGALLLFLRDLWAGAGWGVLDDQGAPKSCFHALRGVLQPLAVFFTDEGGNGVDVHVVHEGAARRALVLELAAWREGEVRVAHARRPVALPGRGNASWSCVDLLDHFVDLNHAYRFGPPTCDLLTATLLDAEERVVARGVHFPLGLAGLVQPRADGAGLEVQCIQATGQTAQVTIGARRLAIGVHLDVPGWEARDDHVHLAPGERLTLHLRRVRDGAALAGRLLAVNASTAVPVELAA
jgi:beta-mannosidase